MFNRRRWIPRNPENISWAKTILVPGEGPMPAKIMGIGQGPGFQEATAVPPTPFQPSAPAGGELNMYLEQINLPREHWYLTNAYKYFVVDQFGSDRPPTTSELQSQWDILEGEINLCQPKVIVCLGAVALKWMMRKAHLHYHTAECHRGMSVGYYKGAVVFSSTHPAAGVHSPDSMKFLVADFDNLKTVLRQVDRGDIVTLPQDEYEGATDYRRITTEAELDAVWCDDIPFLSLDTEGTRKHPIMLQMSWIEGTGYAIYASDRHLVEAFRRRVLRYARTPGNKILMHNALYDIGVLAAMGIELPDGSWLDTMVMAFLLGTEPLGLKPLGYRLRGMKMQSYEEQIGPKSEEMALNYLLEAATYDWPPAQEMLIRDGAEFRMYRPQSIGVRINKILQDWAEQESRIEHITHIEVEETSKKGETKLKRHTHDWFVKRFHKCPEGCHEVKVEREEPVDLRDRWYKKGEKITEDVDMAFETTGQMLRAPVEEKLGRMPEATLLDIPEEQALNYACLSNGSLVWTADGYEPIGRLVKTKASKEVYGVDPTTGQICLKPITGWHRVEYKEKIKWYTVQTEYSLKGRWGPIGASRYTADHKILSQRGMVPITELTPADRIAMPINAFTKVQRQVILGSLLGDGSISRRNRGGWPIFRCSHSEAQVEYLLWKAETLREHLSLIGVALAKDTVRQINGHTLNAKDHFSLGTKHHPELSILREQAYPARSKSCFGPWVEEIDRLALAILYQDDGTRVGPRGSRIYTLAYSVQDVDYLRELLLRKFDLHTTRYEARPKQWVIAVRVRSQEHFWAIISPHVHPSMGYKLPEDFRGGFRPPIQEPPRPLFAKVQKVFEWPQSEGRHGSSYVAYCIDVKDIHNFCTQSEVAKNCRDSDATQRIGPLLLSRVKGLDLQTSLDIDMGVQPILARMVQVGIPADRQHFINFGKDCRNRMDQIEFEIYELVGRSINLASGPQLSNLLFNELKLPSARWTKSHDQLSVDKKALEPLRYMHPVVPLVLEWSELATLKNNFAEVLPQKLDENSRIHCKIGQTRVPSGRLNTSDPNLMAQPTRSELGETIRCGFIAPPGFRFVTTDASQIELRCEGFLSMDKKLVNIFQTGRDAHTDTGAWMLGITYEEMNKRIKDTSHPLHRQAKEKRAAGKTINFGLVNLITGVGLLDQFKLQGLAANPWAPNTRYLDPLLDRKGKQVYSTVQNLNGEPHRFIALSGGVSGYREPDWNFTPGGITQAGAVRWQEAGEGWTADKGNEFIAGWMRNYSGVPAWHETLFAEARRFGYVRDLFGRLRYSPEIRSSIKRIEEAGRKQIANHPIQSTAISIVKIAMRLMWEQLRKWWAQGMKIEPMLNVHDEALFLVEEKAVDEVGPVLQHIMGPGVQEEMERMGYTLPFPLLGAWGSGKSWGEIEK